MTATGAIAIRASTLSVPIRSLRNSLGLLRERASIAILNPAA
jgi:hypothetical protein